MCHFDKFLFSGNLKYNVLIRFKCLFLHVLFENLVGFFKFRKVKRNMKYFSFDQNGSIYPDQFFQIFIWF